MGLWEIRKLLFLIGSYHRRRDKRRESERETIVFPFFSFATLRFSQRGGLSRRLHEVGRFIFLRGGGSRVGGARFKGTRFSPRSINRTFPLLAAATAISLLSTCYVRRILQVLRELLRATGKKHRSHRSTYIPLRKETSFTEVPAFDITAMRFRSFGLRSLIIDTLSYVVLFASPFFYSPFVSTKLPEERVVFNVALLPSVIIIIHYRDHYHY